MSATNSGTSSLLTDDSGATYNSTNNTAVINISGNAATSTDASNVTVIPATTGIWYPTFVSTTVSGNKALNTYANFNYNVGSNTFNTVSLNATGTITIASTAGPVTDVAIFQDTTAGTTRSIRFMPNSGNGSWNYINNTGDCSVFARNVAGSTQPITLTIANSISGGVRVAPASTYIGWGGTTTIPTHTLTFDTNGSRFNTIPKTSVAPYDGDDLCNKTYVDSTSGPATTISISSTTTGDWFPTFVTSQSGTQAITTDIDLKYNAGSNTLSLPVLSATTSAQISGTLTMSSASAPTITTNTGTNNLTISTKTGDGGNVVIAPRGTTALTLSSTDITTPFNNITLSQGTSNLRIGLGATTGSAVNLMIGQNVPYSMVSGAGGGLNTIYGNDSGKNMGSGAYYNTLMGHGAASGLVSGTLNLFMGIASGFQSGGPGGSGAGSYNTAVGTYAGAAMTNSASANCLLGTSAGRYMLDSYWNTCLGTDCGQQISNGADRNTFVGGLSGPQTAANKLSGANNVALGYQAGNLMVGAAGNNTFVGTDAGKGNTTGSSNVFVGFTSGYQSAGESSQNVCVGVYAGDSMTGVASGNTLLGYEAGSGITTGLNNTIIGSQAGTNITGQNNIVIGQGAQVPNGAASNQISIGLAQDTMYIPGSLSVTGAAYAPTASSGTNNTQIATTAFVQTAISSGGSSYWTALTNNIYSNNTGNVGIGTTAPSKKLEVIGDALINGLTIGKGSGGSSLNTALGYQAIYSNTTGLYNTAVGYQSMYFNISGQYNTAVGFQAMYGSSGISTGANNCAFGYSALKVNTYGEENVAIGSFALKSNTGGAYNTAIGYASLFSNTGGEYNTAIGYNALFNTTSSSNTSVGYEAGMSNTSGTNNTFIGSSANCSSGNFSNSTAIGTGAQITANNQIVLGRSNETVNIPGSLNVTGVSTFSKQILTTPGQVITATSFIALTTPISNIYFINSTSILTIQLPLPNSSYAGSRVLFRRIVQSNNNISITAGGSLVLQQVSSAVLINTISFSSVAYSTEFVSDGTYWCQLYEI